MLSCALNFFGYFDIWIKFHLRLVLCRVVNFGFLSRSFYYNPLMVNERRITLFLAFSRGFMSRLRFQDEIKDISSIKWTTKETNVRFNILSIEFAA